MPYDPEETRKLFEMLEEYLTPEEKEELRSPRRQTKARAGEAPSSENQASALQRTNKAQPSRSVQPPPPTAQPKVGELAPRRPTQSAPTAQPKARELALRRPTQPAPHNGIQSSSKISEPLAKKPVDIEIYDNDIIPMRPGSGRGKNRVVMYDVEIEDNKGEKNEEGNQLSDASGINAGDNRKDKKRRAELNVDIGDENTKLKYDFDKNYKDIREKSPLRPRREKRTGLIGGILYAAFVLCVSLVLGSVMWMATADVLGFASSDELVNITVPAGFTMDDIIDVIYDAQLIKYKSLFRIYADYSKAEEKITAGSYVLNKNLDYRSIVYAMTARGGARLERAVPLPEGFSLNDMFARFEEYGICTADKLWEAATNHDFKYYFLDSSTLGQRNRLEGFLFPDTYNFYIDSSAASVITKLLDEFNNKFTETYIERAEHMGYTISEIITIASMIEREAGNDEERSRIAAVIYNRLDSGEFPRLQIDATIHYAIAGTGIPFSTEYDSPYNTYMYDGLPPGPISNPGIASIRAALYPDSTNEYYYALSKSGTHVFFKTFREHEAFVNSDEYDG